MEIAPGIKASRWRALSLDSPDSPDWVKAVLIFDKRIRARYLQPVEILVRRDEKRKPSARRFGFTILAIDRLLIETLQAFRVGLTDTRHESRKMFRSFLTKRPRFKEYFNDQVAEEFYDNIRCGILHQAEVRGGWRIWSVGPLLAPQRNGVVLNRSDFHRSLVEEFENYKSELSDPSAVSLRECLRKKMDHICTQT